LGFCKGFLGRKEDGKLFFWKIWTFNQKLLGEKRERLVKSRWKKEKEK
jgi:hypothetical protein